MCTIVADISNEATSGGPDTGDTIGFTFQWDPVSKPLCLGHVLGHLEDELIGKTLS